MRVDRCRDIDELIEPDPNYSPDAGTGLLSPISYKRWYAEFYVGKVSRITMGTARRCSDARVHSLSCRDTVVAPPSAVLVNYAVAGDDATVTIILLERTVWRTEHSATEANRLVDTCVPLINVDCLSSCCRHCRL